MPKGNRVIIKSIVFLITTLSPSLIDSAKQLIINVLTLGNSSFKISSLSFPFNSLYFSNVIILSEFK